MLVIPLGVRTRRIFGLTAVVTTIFVLLLDGAGVGSTPLSCLLLGLSMANDGELSGWLIVSASLVAGVERGLARLCFSAPLLLSIVLNGRDASIAMIASVAVLACFGIGLTRLVLLFS